MANDKTKFNSLNKYYSDEFDYKLLPFKFIQLDTDRYVLTNLVGEHLVVSRKNLNIFVKKQLSVNSDLYHNLKAKHFLYDDKSDVAINLLALKYRTKKNRLSNFTNLHIFVVSLRCDHSCPYCQVSRQNLKGSLYNMTEETADRGLDFAFRSPSTSIKIEFQGGEPLLNFDLIKYIVLSAENRSLEAKKYVQFVIATNLAFIDDEILAFCDEHKIQISTSLDGPEDLHNKNRPRPGKNSYELTINGINKVRQALGYDSVSALMTTTKNSLSRANEIIDEYVKLGFNSIFLRPLSPYGFAIKTKTYSKYDTQSWLNFYFEGLDYILQINKQGYFFAEQYASIILKKMFSPDEPGYVDLQSPAGIGIAAIVFNYDGDVYASDEARMLAEMNDKTFRLGNLNNDSYEDIICSDALLDTIEQTMTESVPGCSDCGFQAFCGSDPVFHHATQGDRVGHKPSSAFCHKNMEITRHLIRLMEDSDETKSILMNWIR